MEASTVVAVLLGPVVMAAPVRVLVLAPVLAVAPPSVLLPLLAVLGPVELVLVAVVELPVDDPPAALLVVFPPEIVPVVVLVEFWLVWGLFVGLMVTFAAELFEAADVPLRLLLLVVPEADEGLDVSPTV